MILPAILSTLKGKVLLGVFGVFTTIAVTEAFLGQLIIAVIVALIGATPPTVAIIIMSRKQSEERLAGNKELLEGQKGVLKAVDGQTTKLVEATEKFSHLAGKEEERKEQLGRDGAEALARETEAPTPVIVENSPEKPAHVKTV